MAKKTFKLSTFFNLVLGFLLFVLGVVVGHRFQNQISSFSTRLARQNSNSVLSRVVGEVTPPPNLEADFNVFWEVWHLLENEYLDADKLDANKMVDGAIQGMTQAAGDPYTIYLPPEDNKRSGEDLQGSFFGIGIELGYVDGVLAVVAPLAGTPAAEAGLEAGDLILRVIDPVKGIDEDSSRWSLVKAVENIRGPRGTSVTLNIYREGVEAPFDVTVRRDEIVVETVQLKPIEYEGEKYAHLILSRFGGRTQAEWNSAVNKILSAQPAFDGIILDLRNNPGGFFELSIEIAGDFIDNDVVVSQQGKYIKQDFRAKGTARLRRFPLVVLVNKGSASASEIVAGALRDDLGVKLIGEQTFGKGTVQERKEVSNGGGVHITIGRWLLPKGDWIHDEGIPVDIEVKPERDATEDMVLQRALQELSSRE